jgi:putative transcriptional regulator
MINGIRLCRLKAGLETDEAIEQLGITKSTIYKIEQGCLNPSIKLLNRMRKVYKCSADEILDGLNIEDSSNIIHERKY